MLGKFRIPKRKGPLKNPAKCTECIHASLSASGREAFCKKKGSFRKTTRTDCDGGIHLIVISCKFFEQK